MAAGESFRFSCGKVLSASSNFRRACAQQPTTRMLTGHWPHWIPVDERDKSNIWFMEAYRNAGCPTEEGTYEAIGPHFRANPYGLEKDVIEKHGIRILPGVPRDFEVIRDYLEKHNIEGIVFWKNGQPQCKIKRSDFGFPWGK